MHPGKYKNTILARLEPESIDRLALSRVLKLVMRLNFRAARSSM